MPNKTLVRPHSNRYKSELVAFLSGNTIQPNNPSEDAILVPCGMIEGDSVIEIEAAGTLLQNSGFSRIIRYNIGVMSGGELSAPVSLTEQTAVASSSANFYRFRFRYTGRPNYAGGVFEAQRTTGSSVGNNQVAISTLRAMQNESLFMETERRLALKELILSPFIDTSLGESISDSYYAIKVVVHTPLF